MPELEKLRALVVDDSAYNRRTITSMLQGQPGVEVVGRAINGKEALRMAFSLKPDVITLDLEMPEMDGFSFLRLLMSKQPTPVLVVSSYSQRENVFRALELGALDFIAKPTREVSPDIRNIEHDLRQKIEIVRKLQVVRLRERARSIATLARPRPKPLPERAARPSAAPAGAPARRVIGVAASTGGPPAVQQVLCALPADFSAAVLIAQHMPARFTKAFADRLDRLVPMRVLEAQDGLEVQAGTVYIAPGSGNLEVSGTPGDAQVRIVAPTKPGRPGPVITPSGDHLFTSLATVYGHHLCAVVLTGMGSDGRDGCRAAKESGARILAEDPESAVMPGMPHSVIEAGLADQVIPIEALAAALLEFCGGA
ncbi:MAG: chemotaxis-specific protein-glutamate methyltransferase CheB [Nannocystaceae bacterium]|nr:chemotaxis-specific protein-glutamate methyltransferase CheB [Nannocystaceae bacterium]